MDGAFLAQEHRKSCIHSEDLPRELTHTEYTFTLDHNLFTNTESRGRPIRDNSGACEASSGQFRDTELFCQVAKHLAQGKIPGNVLEIVR